MAYTFEQKRKIINKVVAKLTKELDIAGDDDELIQEIVKKYDISFEEEPIPVSKRTFKVLVFGALAGRLKDYIKTAHKLHIEEENLEFVSDYDSLKRYDTVKLEYSSTYSDIILGPILHKTVNMGDVSSLRAKINKSPSMFPKLIEASANGELKLSISSFKNALQKTRLYFAD